MSEQTRREILMMAGALALSSGAAASVPSAPKGAPPASRLPKIENDADLDRILPEITNWNRWGANDRRGTLNYITLKKRIAAARLVRKGRAVSLARELAAAEVERGQLEVTRRPRGARDFIGMVYHGYTMTHLDGLGHIFTEDQRLYNGISADVVEKGGMRDHGVELLAPNGIVSRGVLLDIARLEGYSLPPGTPITRVHLDRAERAQKVVVGEGDILFVRTGAGRANTRERHSGLHPDCLPWLHSRRVALLGGDGDNDVEPLPGFDKWSSPMHTVGITHMGMPLIDNAELDALAQACVDEARWEFLTTISPLRLKGATGSPVNPIAML